MRIATLITLSATLFACGGNDNGNSADNFGVGAECSADGDCLQPLADAGPAQHCLLQFKGGYCGIENCQVNADCPNQSACVMHTDGHNYCFRTCLDKTECNVNRSPDNESNCSANIDFTDGTKTQNGKACVPPSAN